MATTTDSIGNLIISDSKGPRPTVVLFQPDPSELARWEALLHEHCNLRAAPDLHALDEALEQSGVDVVVTSQLAEELLDRLQGRRHTRLIHCSSQVREPTLDAAARGILFSHLDDPDEIADTIRNAAFPRSQMARHEVPGLILRWRDDMAGYAVLEISNDGFSFRVDAQRALDSMLPGTVLEDVEIAGPLGTALSGGSAIVRHVELIEGGGDYAIGCQMRHRPRTEAPGPVTIIQDRAMTAGLLRNALRLGGVVIEHVDFTDWELYARAGEVDTASHTMRLVADPDRLQPFDVVRGRFEQGGAVYRFLSCVVTREPHFLIKLPTRLEVMHHRGSGRFLPGAAKPIHVELHSALLGTSAIRSVRDISSTGFSLDIDPLTDLFPPGTYFDRVVLKLDGIEIAARGRVRNLTRRSGPQESARCGVELEDIDDETRIRLSERIIALRFPGLVDGRRVSFDRLWKFFLDTSFIYPEKEQALAPLRQQIRHTVEAVNTAPNNLFNSVVALDGDEVVGHISGVRMYRRAWLCQHLAAASGKHAGSLLNLGQAEYIAQHPDLEFWKLCFRPDNKWPARVFGGYARTITDPRLSDLRTYAYLTIPTDTVLPSVTGLEVGEADERELSLVERYFVRRERGALLRADDLAAGALRLGELDARYAKIGLQRRRHVLVVRRGRRPLGFCLAEVSSPGLNFSELLSAFRVFVLPDGEAEAATVRIALTSAALRLYREAGRPMAVGLVPVAEQVFFDDIGLETPRRYTVFTCHRTLIQRFADHVDRLARMLERRTQTKLSVAE